MQIGLQRGALLGEIVGAPIENLRDSEMAGSCIETVAAAITEEAPLAVVQLRIEFAGNLGFAAQGRAAYGGTVNREVDA